MSAVSRWEEQNIQLEFWLGGFRLTRATFRGLLAKHGLGMAIDSAIPNLLPGFDVAVILAYPSSNLVRRCDGFEHVFPYIPYHYERYYVDLSRSFADYETKFHSKAHYTLRKKLQIQNSIRRHAPLAGVSPSGRDNRFSFAGKNNLFNVSPRAAITGGASAPSIICRRNAEACRERFDSWVHSIPG